MSKVVLFSTSTCSWCRRAKRYFRERRVPFKEINVDFSNYCATVQDSAGQRRRAKARGHEHEIKRRGSVSRVYADGCHTEWQNILSSRRSVHPRGLTLESIRTFRTVSQGVLSETSFPANTILGNSAGMKRAEAKL